MTTTTTIQRFAASTPGAILADAMRRDGCVVIEGLIDAAAVGRMNDELASHVARRPDGLGGDTYGDFWGSNTVRFQGLATKSPTYVSAVMLNPVLLAIADEILRPNCGDYWISQTETIFIGPGENAQELHRDDLNWSYATAMGIDLQFSALVAVGDYDAECGATMAIPGSHLWPRDKPVDPSLAAPVELEPGSALVYLGSLVHGGGRNATTDRVRKAVYCGYLLGWLTREEATALSLTPEDASSIPPRARQLLGWSSQRGNKATSGVAGAMQLWQLDDDDLGRYDGLFSNDPLPEGADR
jgi:ectoine hydroxylase-related dioxygenase (phytanoyl-CoA dioxygenase family)